MSEVGATQFTPEERERLLADVRTLLPAFLAPSAVERVDPLGDVSALLDLDPRELDRVTCVHLLLREPIRGLLGELRHGLRRPLTSSVREAESARVIRGQVDWAATHAQRARGGQDRTAYVVRPARRVFGGPENGALKWLIEQLAEAAQAAPDSLAPKDGWQAEIARGRSALREARRVPWLADVEPRRPDAAVLARLASARSGFYRRVGEAARAVQRWREQPSPEDLTELLCDRWFHPSNDATLFEVVVALRIAMAFAAVSPGPRQMRMLVHSEEPAAAFARYALPQGDAVDLWSQHWPPDSGASSHRDALERHGMRRTPTRPDLLIQRTGSSTDAVVLELKASRSVPTLTRGLSQLLGYLHERPQLFQRQPAAWLVAPANGPFEAADAPDDPLWIVDADRVAEMALRRFCPQPR